MRATKWVPALAVALALAAVGTAHAQRTFTMSGPVNLGPAQTVPQGGDLPVGLNQNLNRSGFTMRNFLPNFNMLFFSTRQIGRSYFPTQKQLPNANYLKPFQYGAGVSAVQ
jgi:hypothetical protein